MSQLFWFHYTKRAKLVSQIQSNEETQGVQVVLQMLPAHAWWTMRIGTCFLRREAVAWRRWSDIQRGPEIFRWLEPAASMVGDGVWTTPAKRDISKSNRNNFRRACFHVCQNILHALCCYSASKNLPRTISLSLSLSLSLYVSLSLSICCSLNSLSQSMYLALLGVSSYIYIYTITHPSTLRSVLNNTRICICL